MRRDLVLHYRAGLALGLFFGLLAGLALAVLGKAPAVLAATLGGALGWAVADRVGWAKEYWWDAKGRGTVDRDDYLQTRRGGYHGASLAFVAVVVAGAWL